MAAIGAANITIVVTDMSRHGKKKRHQGTMTFGDGSLTYSTAGLPLPAPSAFGFLQQMDELQIIGNNARTSDYQYRYNKSAHKLLCYEEEAAAAGGPLLECDTSEAPAARVLDWVAWGW
jgi:hypothetical protein